MKDVKSRSNPGVGDSLSFWLNILYLPLSSHVKEEKESSTGNSIIAKLLAVIIWQVWNYLKRMDLSQTGVPG